MKRRTHFYTFFFFFFGCLLCQRIGDNQMEGGSFLPVKHVGATICPLQPSRVHIQCKNINTTNLSQDCDLAQWVEAK